jgi:hypothetical protein
MVLRLLDEYNAEDFSRSLYRDAACENRTADTKGAEMNEKMPVTCVTCGKEFFARRAMQKTCGFTCRQKNIRNRAIAAQQAKQQEKVEKIKMQATQEQPKNTKLVKIVKNTKTGTVRMVYCDEAAPLLEALGDVQTCRATDVEPNGQGQWEAVLRDGDGTVLAQTKNRKDAIAQEVEYLNTHVIPDQKKFDEVFNG